MKLTPSELRQHIIDTAKAVSEGIIDANAAGYLSLRHPEFIEIQVEVVLESGGLNAIERVQTEEGTRSTEASDPEISRRSIKRAVTMPERVRTEEAAESTEITTETGDSRRTESGTDIQTTVSDYDS